MVFRVLYKEGNNDDELVNKFNSTTDGQKE